MNDESVMRKLKIGPKSLWGNRSSRSKKKSKETGFILITVLMLTTILSVASFIAFEQSQLAYRVQGIRMAFKEAQIDSDNRRMEALSMLENLLKRGEKVGLGGADAFSPLPKFSGDDAKSTNSQVFVRLHPPSLSREGVSLVQHRAYAGLGSGLGQAGSIFRYAEVKAKGVVPYQGSQVEAWTASDLRVVLQ